MPSEPRAVIVVAHPDDEVIFFGGLASRLVGDGWSVDVVCVTGRFGSPRTTAVRRAEFFRACWAMGVKARLLGLPDSGGLLDEEALARDLARRVRWDAYSRVYTHGPWGEYGHPHHVQVCRAVHRFGGFVRCLAGPFEPDVHVELSRVEWHRKRELCRRFYPSQPFAADWCTAREDLVVLGLDAIEFLASIALSEGGVSPVSVPALASEAARPEGATFPDVRYVPKEMWYEGHRARVAALRRAQADAQNGAGSPVTDFSK